MNEIIQVIEDIYPLQWALICSVVFILFVTVKTKSLMAMGISCVICTLGLTGFYFTERKAEDQQVKMYGNAIQMFYNDFGYLPAEQDAISNVLYPLTFPIDGYGPYIETERYKERDVWNEPYVYHKINDHQFVVYSKGILHKGYFNDRALDLGGPAIGYIGTRH